MAGPEPGDPGRRSSSSIACIDRRHLPLRARPRLQARSSRRSCSSSRGLATCSAGMSSTPIRATRTRSRPISSTGSTRWASAPRFRRVVVPTEQVIETKDGQKVQTEKRVLPGLRAREHGPERRRLDGRQEHARRDRLRRRRREARAARRRPRSTASSTPAPPPASARARRSSSARRVGQGHLGPLSDFDGEIVDVNPDAAEAEGARRHLRAPGAGRARVRPGEEDSTEWRKRS